MWTGVRPSASYAVRSGMKHILFIEPSEEVAGAIEAWLQSLRPLPGPVRDKAAVERGRKLFFSAEVGCSACHPPPLYTDNELHDVGTHGPADFTSGQTPQNSFKTPSLLEAWRTAPYLHDGRYATLREVITQGNRTGLRGHTEGLTRSQVDDLLAFLSSL
jgi:cytochrome c peroxidase